MENQVGRFEGGVGCAHRAGVQLDVAVSVRFELKQRTPSQTVVADPHSVIKDPDITY